MTTISAKSDIMTLINMFTVEPANQRRLVELLTEATEVSTARVFRFAELQVMVLLSMKCGGPLAAVVRTSGRH